MMYDQNQVNKKQTIIIIVGTMCCITEQESIATRRALIEVVWVSGVLAVVAVVVVVAVEHDMTGHGVM